MTVRTLLLKAPEFDGAAGTLEALDLDLWDRLEARRPPLFVGMHHLWGQEPSISGE